jgi:DNA repair protein RadC
MSENTIYELETFTVKLRDVENEHYEKKANEPEQVAEIGRKILDTEDADQEHFYYFAVDGKNKIKGVKKVSTGTLTSSLIHPREVYKGAILFGAAALIFLHNHPSGDTTPSKEDIQITERLMEVGEMVGISVLDHVIVTRMEDTYSSFQELDII